MYMPYTTNPYLPKLRAEALDLIYVKGWSMRKISRRYGVCPSTVSRWYAKSRGFRLARIPTESSRPLHHPFELPAETVEKVLDYRKRYNRCAKVLHHLLTRDGIRISLSSIERILRRNHLINHSRWKKWHRYPPRPLAEKPGILVQIDTVWQGIPENRLYLYTLLDVCSRWAYAMPCERINTHKSLSFVKGAQLVSPFRFQTLQSDHGSEFSLWFTKRINEYGLAHRHSRVRTPSDNGHLERFNRTLQEECIGGIPRSLKAWKREIPEYLRYYNNERPHMALEMKTPNEVLRSY
jgi:transposase InsO family protein